MVDISHTSQISRRQDGQQRQAPAILPPVDIWEDENGITLCADMPGVGREQLNVRVDGETLTIEGEAKLDAPANMEPLYVEINSPRYRRSFALSRELAADKINAKIQDGVLTLNIPKSEEAKPRRIEVKPQ